MNRSLGRSPNPIRKLRFSPTALFTCSALAIDRRHRLMSFAMTSSGFTRGETSNGRTRNHVSLPGFVVRQAVSLRALCTRAGFHRSFCSSQQSAVHVSVAHRYESHYRMQIVSTSMLLAEDPPASVFRVPIARVCSLRLRHSALEACVRACGSADWPGNCFCPARAMSAADNGTSDGL